jgi:intracellular multiplication protein IcmL
LEKSNNLDAVRNKKLSVSAAATGAPILLAKGALDNIILGLATDAPIILKKNALNHAFAWRVQIPMVVTYQNAKEYTQQAVIVTMIINRTLSVNSPTGVAINQFSLSPTRKKNNPNMLIPPQNK